MADEFERWYGWNSVPVKAAKTFKLSEFDFAKYEHEMMQYWNPICDAFAHGLWGNYLKETKVERQVKASDLKIGDGVEVFSNGYWYQGDVTKKVDTHTINGQPESVEATVVCATIGTIQVATKTAHFERLRWPKPKFEINEQVTFNRGNGCGLAGTITECAVGGDRKLYQVVDNIDHTRRNIHESQIRKHVDAKDAEIARLKKELGAVTADRENWVATCDERARKLYTLQGERDACAAEVVILRGKLDAIRKLVP